MEEHPIGGGGGGGGGDVSAADPKQLMHAAAAFQLYCNQVGALLRVPQLQSGGTYEQTYLGSAAMRGQGIDLGPDSFGNVMATAVRDFVGVLVSLGPQLADATTDLADVAGAFTRADSGGLPPHCTKISEENGLTVWQAPDGTKYVADREGHVELYDSNPADT
jgi:hypothetical protein